MEGMADMIALLVREADLLALMARSIQVRSLELMAVVALYIETKMENREGSRQGLCPNRANIIKFQRAIFNESVLSYTVTQNGNYG